MPASIPTCRALALLSRAMAASPGRLAFRCLSISSRPQVNQQASIQLTLHLIPKRILIHSERTLAITRPSCNLVSTTKTAMLTQYLGTFMATIQRGVSNASARQLEIDHIASLLAEPKANKRVKIHACGPLYVELSKTKPILFSSAPHEGIEFDVPYFDSLELLEASNKERDDRRNVPIVCLLHGAPGHYKDFAGLIYHLTSEGVRVIAPNFPTYSATFEHSFRHSPRERLEYLLEFFKAIQVTQIDLLAGHSSAVYTMFELLNHSKQPRNPDSNRRVEIKSLGLFSTPSHVLPHNLAVTPVRLFTLKLFDYPLLRPVIMTLILAFVKIQGIRNRVDRDKIDNLLIAASAMGYSQHAKMADRLKLLTKFRIPTLLVYGTNDRLITVNNFKQLEQDLGITSDQQVRRYKSDGSVESLASERHELVDVSRFESGGHYTFQKYSSQVSDDLYNFLVKRVLKCESRSSDRGDSPNEATKL